MQNTFMQILTPNYTPNFYPQIGISLAFALRLQNSWIFAPSISKVCVSIIRWWALIRSYEGESISNQPIPFPMDRDGHDFHALFQYMFF